jgi:acyl-CoA oxidase
MMDAVPTTPGSPRSALDVGALQRLLDGEHRAIREQVRQVLGRPEFRPVAGLSVEDYRQVVLDRARALAREGHASLGFPKEFGGSDNVGGAVAAFETMAHGDLSLLVKIGVQFGLFGGAVLHLGTRHHHEAHLEDILTLRLPGCFAMTETGHGSDVQALETTATYDAETEEFVVHTPRMRAHKDYIGNAAAHGRMAVVFAQLVVAGEVHGVHALLVPIREEDGRHRPGVRIEDCGEKVGLNGVDNGRITFDGVRVPRSALLDRFATVTPDGRYSSSIESPNRRFFSMLSTLIQGRVSVSGAALSAAKSALTIATRYALTRRQFAPNDGEETLLLDYRTHQRRLLPPLATTFALHFAQEQLVAELHRAFTSDDYPERERRVLESTAAGLKAMTTWHAVNTIQTCREACGGAGYLAENRFAALRADTDVFTTFEGDNTVLLLLVAKSLLTDYKDEFGDLDALGMVRFVAGQVLGTVTERTSARQLVQRVVDAVPAREDDARVLERDFHLDVFRWREDHVLGGVARRLKRGTDSGDDPFAVLIACQDHLVSAAKAHVDRLVLEAFVAAIEGCQDASLVAVLDGLCDLYALSTIERDRGWFQEHGRLSGERSKAVVREVNRRCAELRGPAGSLVDAFGIPDDVLAAPIARAPASGLGGGR